VYRDLRPEQLKYKPSNLSLSPFYSLLVQLLILSFDHLVLFFSFVEYGFDSFVGKSANEPRVRLALEVAEENLASVVERGAE
jgi:hypothetical protein